MHIFLFDTFGQFVCIHTVLSLLYMQILAEWSSVDYFVRRYQPFPMGVDMCGFVLSDSRHTLAW